MYRLKMSWLVFKQGLINGFFVALVFAIVCTVGIAAFHTLGGLAFDESFTLAKLKFKIWDDARNAPYIGMFFGGFVAAMATANSIIGLLTGRFDAAQINPYIGR